MPSLSAEEINVVARRQVVGYPTAVPQCYLDELKRHVNLYPHDTNFRIQLQPGLGLGVVTCLEAGCEGARIELAPRVSKSDGGRKDGLGSLSAYRKHVEDHPTHLKNRHARVNAELAEKERKRGKRSTSGTPSTSRGGSVAQTKRPSLLMVLDEANAGGASSSSTPKTNGAPLVRDKRSSMLSVLDGASGAPPSGSSSSIRGAAAKAEPTEPSVPKADERTSESAGGGWRRALLQRVPQSLLSVVDGVASRSSSTPAATTSKNPVKGEQVESAVSKNPNPKKRTLLQSTFPFKFEETEESRALQPSGTPPPAKKLKLESSAKSPLSPRKVTDNAIVPSAPVRPAPFSPTRSGAVMASLQAPSANTDATREALADIQTQIRSAQAMLERAGRKARKSKADLTRITKLSTELNRLNGEKARLTAAIPSVPVTTLARQPSSGGLMAASGSNVQLPPAFHHPGLARPGVNVGLGMHGTVQSEDVKSMPGAYHDKENAGPSTGGMRLGNVVIDNWAPEDDSGDERFDRDGDFYGRGKDTFVGPQAKADDINMFLLNAGNAEQFDGNERVDKALEKLGLNNLYAPLPGMTIALMPHQAIGVAWMLEKEKNKVFKGGALCDEMGLGKTVQMISVIVSNRSDDPARKTNLIVAPVALLDQWQMEIEMKTTCDLKCLIYHGTNKPKKKTELMKYDIVLTSFSTLAFEWPDEEAEAKKKEQRRKKARTGFVVSDSDDEGPSQKGTKKKKTLGLLFQIPWHRVILDEAQNIRNRRTRISRAVTKLDSEYRWCLTGTPINNGLSDAYPLMRFLQIRPWYDWAEYNSHIAIYEKKNPSLASTRLQAIFASMLIRRKKDSQLDGQRLVELPEKTVNLHKLTFSPEERDIYNMVEAKQQAIFNRFLRAGTVLKNYHQVLVMLLRLRQICSHPSLIYEQGDAYVDPDEVDEDGSSAKVDLSRAKQLLGLEFVDKMQSKMKQIALERMAAEKESKDATVEDDCPICFDGMTDPVVTPCTHCFCRECIKNVLSTPYVEDADHNIRYRANERPCPACRAPVSGDRLFSRLAFEPSDAELSGDAPVKDQAAESEAEMPDVSDILEAGKGKGKGKAKAVQRKRAVRKKAKKRVLDSDSEEEEDDEDDDDMSDFIVHSDEDEEEKDARRALKKRLGKARAIILDSDDEAEIEEVIHGKREKPQGKADGKIELMSRFLPSTKMKHMMETLKRCATDHPDEKTIIVSQWTECLQLVSDYLTENEILHVKYQGDMGRAKRDLAVRVFMQQDKAPVMLMSLKCGGVGLNLTRANRVISLDLGWSEAVENQAFDRVHRLGQTRQVFVERLVIADTVEDRILALQERKRNLADGSLGEGTGKKIGRLNVRELARLFGVRA